MIPTIPRNDFTEKIFYLPLMILINLELLLMALDTFFS